MAGTNAYAAKRKLIDLLAASPLTDAGVSVAYSWPGDDRAGRECVYGGPVTWSTRPLAMRGGGRMPRREDLTVPIHVDVSKPGAEGAEVEARAVEIGTVVEELIAADTTLSGVPGLQLAGISGGQLAHAFEDELAFAVLTYQVTFLSTLDA
jgi:hypothetical protein